MNILLNDNNVTNLDFVTNEVDDLRYCVLDYSDRREVDYMFPPLVFMEVFNAPALVLQIGKHIVKMPIDWSVVICDKVAGEPEVMPLVSVSDKGFTAFAVNPISDYMPSFYPIDIINVYQDVKWHVPTLKAGTFLAVPLSDEPGAQCVYFIKETNKVPDVLDIEQLW